VKKHVEALGRYASGLDAVSGGGLDSLKLMVKALALEGRRERPEQKLTNLDLSCCVILSSAAQKN